MARVAAVRPPLGRRLLTPLRQRLAWNVVDQGLSSLTNLGLSLMVARTVSVAAFGAFSVAFTTYLIVIGLTRALVAEPFLVRHSAAEPEGPVLADQAGAAVGTALGLGLGGGALCLLAGAVAGGALGGSLAALGLVLPGLVLQDAWRYVFFARGRPRQAAANDAVWALVLAGALVVLTRTGSPAVATIVLAWGAGAAVGAVMGAVQARTVPRPARTWAYVRSTGDLSSRFVAEYGATYGATHLTLYGVGAIAGLPALGAIRAAQVLLGPLNVLVTAVGAAAVPEGVRARRESLVRLRRGCQVLVGVVLGATVTFAGVALLLPTALGEALLGASWSGARALVVPVAATMAGGGVAVGAVSGLRSLGRAADSLRAMASAAPVGLVAALGGAALAGSAGAAWGFAAGAWAAGAIAWRAFAGALRAERATQSEGSRYP